MRDLKSNDTPDKPVALETSGPRIYDADTPTAAKKSPSGVYDAPARAGGPSVAMIVGIVIAVLILAFLLFQVVF